MARFRRRFDMVMVLLFLSVLFSSVSAQVVTLSGVVKDSATLEVIADAEVKLLKSGVVVITQGDGIFFLNTEFTASKLFYNNSPNRLMHFPQQSVSFSSYSLLGRRLYTLCQDVSSVPSIIPRRNSVDGYSISRIQAGSYTMTYGEICFGKTIGITKNYAEQSSCFYKKGAGVRAVNNPVDTLRIQKKGYATIYLPVTSSITDTTIYLKKIVPGSYNGFWTGYTIEGAPISFDVDSSGKIKHIRYELGISGLTSIVSDSLTNDSALTSVIGNQFSYVTAEDNITGFFSGDTTCAGSIKIGKFSLVERSYLVRKVRPNDVSRSDLFIIITQTSAVRGYTFLPDDTVYVAIRNTGDDISIKAGTYSNSAKIFTNGIVCQPDSFSNPIQITSGKTVIPLKIISADGFDSSFYWISVVPSDGQAGHVIQSSFSNAW